MITMCIICLFKVNIPNFGWHVRTCRLAYTQSKTVKAEASDLLACTNLAMGLCHAMQQYLNSTDSTARGA